MRWGFVLADRFGSSIGELRQADARRLRFPLNRLPTITGTIDVGNPLAPYVLATDQTLVKGYQISDDGTRRLRYIGPITSAEKARQSQSGTIAFSSAGVGWRLSRRLIGLTPAGVTLGTGPLATLDRGAIAAKVLNDLIGRGDGTAVCAVDETGIRVGTIVASAAAYVGPWTYKPADQVIAELSAPLDGFDWEIEPCEPYYDGGATPVIGRFNARPAIGSLQPNALWEFGSGRRNVDNYRDLRDASALANFGYGLPSTSEATSNVVTASDAASIAAHGLAEAVIPGDLIVESLRLQLAQEHVRIRKEPRRVLQIQPIAEDDAPPEQRRVPRLFDDYIVGDVMPFRATESYQVIDPTSGQVIGSREVKEIDAFFRVFAVDLAIDSNGVSVPTTTIIEED